MAEVLCRHRPPVRTPGILAVSCFTLLCLGAGHAQAQSTAEGKREGEKKQKSEQNHKRAPQSAPRSTAPQQAKPAHRHHPEPQKRNVTASQPKPGAETVTCSARPTCPRANGQGNVCRSVRHTYTGSGAMENGRLDIASRCQAANAPDPCGVDYTGTGTNYRLTSAGGCAQQCAGVATCSAAR